MYVYVHTQRGCLRPGACCACFDVGQTRARFRRYRAGSCNSASKGFVCVDKEVPTDATTPRPGSLLGEPSGTTAAAEPGDDSITGTGTGAFASSPARAKRSTTTAPKAGQQRTTASSTGPVATTTGPGGAAAACSSVDGGTGGGSDSSSSAMIALGVCVALLLIGCIASTIAWWRARTKLQAMESAANRKRGKRTTRAVNNVAFGGDQLPPIPTGGGMDYDVYQSTDGASADYATAADAVGSYGNLGGAHAECVTNPVKRFPEWALVDVFVRSASPRPGPHGGACVRQSKQTDGTAAHP